MSHDELHFSKQKRVRLVLCLDMGNEMCKAKFAIKSVPAKNKVQEHQLL